MVVAVTITAVTMAIFVNFYFGTQLNVYVDNVAENQAIQIAPILQSYYSTTGSWDNVDLLLKGEVEFAIESRSNIRGGLGRAGINTYRRMGPLNIPLFLRGQRLILTNETELVIFDSSKEKSLNATLRNAALNKNKIIEDDVTLNNKITEKLKQSSFEMYHENQFIGFLFIGKAFESKIEEGFVNRFNTWLIITAFTSSAFAIIIGLILSRRITAPMRNLMNATELFSLGKFEQNIENEGEDELGQLTKSFNTMAEQLELNENQRQRLFADIAHELRTPLAVIQATIEGMAEGVIETNQKELIRALDQTKTLNRIVEDLRLLSLAESKQLDLKKQYINLVTLINEVIEDLTPIAEESGSKIILKETLQPKVFIDQHRIKQVLSNLIVNALKQAPTNTIEICISDDDNYCLVSVIDSGNGISEQDQKYIFDRFYRVDESRSRTSGGTGLGLAIVKSLIEAHGGNISVSSVQGKGTTFTFTLPI